MFEMDVKVQIPINLYHEYHLNLQINRLLFPESDLHPLFAGSITIIQDFS